ncbi:Uncharacterised protein [Vibrio cholerae]|nr:Uncharacterised protein [Vibrio cholerae]
MKISRATGMKPSHCYSSVCFLLHRKRCFYVALQLHALRLQHQ